MYLTSKYKNNRKLSDIITKQTNKIIQLVSGKFKKISGKHER